MLEMRVQLVTAERNQLQTAAITSAETQLRLERDFEELEVANHTLEKRLVTLRDAERRIAGLEANLETTRLDRERFGQMYHSGSNISNAAQEALETRFSESKKLQDMITTLTAENADLHAKILEKSLSTDRKTHKRTNSSVSLVVDTHTPDGHPLGTIISPPHFTPQPPPLFALDAALAQPVDNTTHLQLQLETYTSVIQDLQADLQAHTDQITLLKRQVRTSVRRESMEQVAPEFLRNIVVQFILASDKDKKGLVSVVSKALELDSEERQRLDASLAPRWF